MTFVNLNPERGFETITKRFNELINDVDKGISFEFGGFTPRVDIMEDDNNVYFFIEVPGMTKDDLKISVNEEKLLTIKGKKTRPNENENKNYITSERVFGEFQREFILADNSDTENIQASFENGILELIIPKLEPPKPKEINVEIK